MKRNFCQILSFTLNTILLLSSSVSVWAIGRPATMYGPLSSSPKPGSLYARAIQLKHAGSENGYMLATFEQYTRGVPVFPVYRSSDGGATWSHISDVTDTRNGWGMRFQPFLYELPQPLGLMPAGTILCFGNSIPHNLSKTQIDMYKSTDKGATWIFVSHIANGGNAIPDSKHGPVWEPFALLANGKLIVYYSDERSKPLHNQMIVHQTSADGVTWGRTIEDVAIGGRSVLGCR